MTLLIIIVSMVTGILLAYNDLLPNLWYKAVLDIDLPFYCLCVMLAVVGYGIGKDKDSLRNLIKGNLYSLLAPLGTVIGTLFGGFVAGLALQITALEAIAVAGGFGWYTFSGVYLAEAYSADLGAVALLSNVFREALAIVMMPLAVKAAGTLPAISMGGATTMDVTLPIIVKYAGQQAGVPAFIHGLIISAIVPIALPLITIHING